MFAVYARYRGRIKRRAEHVAASATAMATLPGVEHSQVIGVEDIQLTTAGAEATAQVILAFLSAGDWALGIGVGTSEELAIANSRASVAKKGGHTGARSRVLASDIAAACTLLSFILARRSAEGREATSLMRQGLNQVQVAAELGVSKQAITQRLAAAGWEAEQAGWGLLVHLLERADAGDA